MGCVRRDSQFVQDGTLSIDVRFVNFGGIAVRQVVWVECVSVDGVVDEPSWTAAFWNDEIAKIRKEQLFRSDALLLGRVTYEAFANSWPSITDPDGFADRMNRMPKHVASRTIKETKWNATVIQGEVRDAVTRMKAEDGGDILVYGSATLVHTLVEHDLIDKFRLMVHPIVVGRGQHLFREGIAMKTLRLVETTPISSGIVVLSYEPVR
jgi:dihydrofolate reductase